MTQLNRDLHSDRFENETVRNMDSVCGAHNVRLADEWIEANKAEIAAVEKTLLNEHFSELQSALSEVSSRFDGLPDLLSKFEFAKDFRGDSKEWALGAVNKHFYAFCRYEAERIVRAVAKQEAAA